MGIAHTRDFLPEEIGRDAQIGETMKAVETAMSDARIDAVSDVHFVQIKCPLLTSERVQDALARGKTTVTASGYASMGYSRGASALGVAKALGEIGAELGEANVLKDWDLYSSVASCSAGIELMHNVVILVGASRFSASPFKIGHAVMKDAIDLPAVIRGARERGLERARPWVASSPRQYFRQGRGLPQRRPSAASATRCSTIPTSTPRATPAPRSAG